MREAPRPAEPLWEEEEKTLGFWCGYLGGAQLLGPGGKRPLPSALGPFLPAPARARPAWPQWWTLPACLSTQTMSCLLLGSGSEAFVQQTPRPHCTHWLSSLLVFSFFNSAKIYMTQTLVVQWLGIGLVMQGTQCLITGWGPKIPLATEQLNPHPTAKPAHHNSRSRVPQWRSRVQRLRPNTANQSRNIFKTIHWHIRHVHHICVYGSGVLIPFTLLCHHPLLELFSSCKMAPPSPSNPASPSLPAGPWPPLLAGLSVTRPGLSRSESARCLSFCVWLISQGPHLCCRGGRTLLPFSGCQALHGVDGPRSVSPPSLGGHSGRFRFWLP